jgi:protease I
MADQVLDGLRIAVLAADGFEQVEVTRPVRALEKHGAEVEIVSLRPGSIQGMNLLVPGDTIDVDRTVLTADADDYHGLHIPGGFINPDFVRQSERALDFVRAFEAAGKPIATICHGPWVLISAGLVEGRRLASWPGIKDDVRNAGGEWVDAKVVHDDNWVSSRGPHDLPAFDRAIVAHFAEAVGREAPSAIREVEWGRWIVGTAAVAAAGFAAQRRLRSPRTDDGWERTTGGDRDSSAEIATNA